jgi:RNA polymerase sigma factor (sigma-70 family)
MRHRTVCMGVSTVSDEALLAGLAAGDREAAAGFVRRFQSRVYGIAVTILGDATAAEDVAQETLVRAWRHASSYDARRGAVSSWLGTIARNLALDRATSGARGR